jgi:predicted DNA-binding WGR domain protein
MDDLLTITFEAHNSHKNHHRRYQFMVGRDLLSDWTIAIRYGRIGQGGRVIRYAAAEARDMQSVIRDRLRRRLSASMIRAAVAQPEAPLCCRPLRRLYSLDQAALAAGAPSGKRP